MDMLPSFKNFRLSVYFTRLEPELPVTDWRLYDFAPKVVKEFRH